MDDRSKRHLERVLRECAESAVPETASPWPAIKDRLGGRETGEAQAVEARAVGGRAMGAPRTRRTLLVPNRPLGWALAALSVLILGLGAYAASGPVRELFGGPLGPGSPGSGEVVMGTPGKNRIDRGGDDHTIRALAGDDTVFDTGGRNVAYGGDGNDWMIVTGFVYGGPGEDQLEPFGEAKASGGPGADVIYAHNDERNTVSCGPGNDTVYFDGKLDSLATDCEKQIPRQFEPPLNVPFDERRTYQVHEAHRAPPVDAPGGDRGGGALEWTRGRALHGRLGGGHDLRRNRRRFPRHALRPPRHHLHRPHRGGAEYPGNRDVRAP